MDYNLILEKKDIFLNSSPVTMWKDELKANCRQRATPVTTKSPSASQHLNNFVIFYHHLLAKVVNCSRFFFYSMKGPRRYLPGLVSLDELMPFMKAAFKVIPHCGNKFSFIWRKNVCSNQFVSDFILLLVIGSWLNRWSFAWCKAYFPCESVLIFIYFLKSLHQGWPKCDQMWICFV